MTHRAPAVATWLLRHFGCSPQNEHVIGDLVERYQHGRSRGWYWRQVLIAIVAGFVTEIRLHPVLVIRALLAGIVLLNALRYEITVTDNSLIPERAWEHQNVLVFIPILTLIACAGSGRLLARMHRPHGRLVLFAFIGWQLLPFLLPFRLFRFSMALFIFGSWIGEFSRQLNVLLWNTGGMTALDGICTACTTSPTGYGTFLILTSALLTVPALLFGGGVLTNNSNGSSWPQTSRKRAGVC